MKSMFKKYIGLHYARGNMEWEEACIAHICVFGCIAYKIILDEKNNKLDTTDTKCRFFINVNELKPIGYMLKRSQNLEMWYSWRII